MANSLINWFKNKIVFKNGAAPALNAANLNQMQDNIEKDLIDLFNNILNQFGSDTPIGAGYDYYGLTEPENYMWADGRELSRTDYAELFEAFGGENSPYGLGDGSTTFNLPDKREHVSAMYKEGSANFGTLGSKIGSSTQAITVKHIPPHDHQLPYIPSSSGTLKTSYGYGISRESATTEGKGNGNAGNLGTAKTGEGQQFNIIQPTLVCNYIIKVK